MSARPCRICQHPTQGVNDFGRMPLGNGFLPPDAMQGEYFYHMQTAFCPSCHMFQLVDQPAAEAMFNEHYHFFSGTSRVMAEHFRQFAELVKSRYLSEQPMVMEIGSNDGIMLQHFAQAGIAHLGIEPSSNVADAARARGMNVISAFFDDALAAELVQQYGQVDAFLGANVMCHIPDLDQVAAGVKRLLKPRGVLMFEDPYLGDVIEKTSYDQIYDEHVYLFAVGSLTTLFARHQLEIIDVMPQTTHGGSMRYVVAHQGAYTVSEAVHHQREKEAALGLHLPETYDRFRQQVMQSRDDLVALLKRLKAEGKRVVGYGATSKSTTILNYCGIGPDLIEFISDTTPIKQGKLTPGMHIPVRPYEAFSERWPDYAVLFAWNHAAEIMAKEQAFVQAGGRFIRFVPRVEIL
ncbi:class I SAM-dependent methyltransferase [Leeia aquatica]|uniref:Class I SAM-dependent methyltransferase n=1 Tax=Leeia aquatica TaxID=2725557 RepID=A0A847SBV8_9NEIS|nr:class I SAM-dependent methyltransferase [Leeia aquatica]NLR74598.1 class I SAM-dependent methyltransferase [Leeia aquatica]